MRSYELSSIIGKTIVSYEIKEGSTELHFLFDDGNKSSFYHEQDCCESVYLNDIAGDLNDLVGSPLVQAEDVSSTSSEPEDTSEVYCESCTWTFYKLATIKGSVTLRWLGESNGYYSERVEFIHWDEEEEKNKGRYERLGTSRY